MIEKYFKLIIKEKMKLNESKAIINQPRKEFKPSAIFLSLVALFFCFDYFIINPMFLENIQVLNPDIFNNYDKSFFLIVKLEILELADFSTFNFATFVLAIKSVFLPFSWVILSLVYYQSHLDYSFRVNIKKQIGLIFAGCFLSFCLFYLIPVVFYFLYLCTMLVNMLICLNIFISALEVLHGLYILAKNSFFSTKNNTIINSSNTTLLEIKKEKHLLLQKILKDNKSLQNLIELKFNPDELSLMNKRINDSEHSISTEDIDYILEQMNTGYSYKEFLNNAVDRHTNNNFIQNI